VTYTSRGNPWSDWRVGNTLQTEVTYTMKQY